jgi:hypothetical protein
LQAQEWVEATMTRLYWGKVSAVLGGLKRMQPTSEEAAHTTWKVIREIWGTQKVLFFEINRLWKRP